MKDQLIGDISLIKTKIVPINEIITKTVSNIKKEINNSKELTIQLNLSRKTGISKLLNIGPKFNIKMKTVRTE